MTLPRSWQSVTIGSVCDPIESIFPQRLYSDYFTYVDISSVDTIQKKVLAPKRIAVEQPPSRARLKLLSNDIIVSTVRPELNAVAQIPETLSEAIASTGFCVLRANPNVLNFNYLFFFVQSDEFVRRLIQVQRGISFPAVRDVDIRDVPIPLPPLEEQQRIIEMLTLADTVRQQRRAATEKAKGLILNLFDEMFLQNPDRDKWPVVTVGEAGNVQLGRQRSPQYQTGRYTKPYLRVANVFEDKIDVSDVLEMDFDVEDFRKYRLAYGDILLNEGQSTELVGRPAMWRDELPECCFQNHLIRFKADITRSYPDYALALFLRYFKDGVFSRLSTKTSNIATLGSKRFTGLDYPLPPKSLQEAFVQRGAAIRGGLNDIETKEARTAQVLGRLAAQAFNGTLTAKWREANQKISPQPFIENTIASVSDEQTQKNNLRSDLEEGFGKRTLFWREVSTGSRLHTVYEAFDPDRYDNAQTIVERLSLSRPSPLTEYEVAIALDTLTAAGLILPVALEMPDPANPSGAVVCIQAYRLLRSGDNGLADFQMPQNSASLGAP